MSGSQIKVWYKRFLEGRETLESDPRPGRSSTIITPEMIARVQAAVHENCELTERELGKKLGIPRVCVSEILTKVLGMKRLSGRFVRSVSEILTEDLGKKTASGNFVQGSLLQQEKDFGDGTLKDLLQTANNYPNFAQWLPDQHEFDLLPDHDSSDVPKVSDGSSPAPTSHQLSSSPALKRLRLDSEASLNASGSSVRPKTDGDDGCAAFAKMVGGELKAMDLTQRTIAKKLINEALYHGLMGVLHASSAVQVLPCKQEVDHRL